MFITNCSPAFSSMFDFCVVQEERNGAVINGVRGYFSHTQMAAWEIFPGWLDCAFRGDAA